MALNIADLFEHAVDAVPDRVALVFNQQRRTFRQLDEEANRFAHHLLAEGFGVGDHIGIYAQNSAEWLIAMVAIFKIRAVPININYRYVTDELAYLFDNADLVALVHGREYVDRIAEVRSVVPALRHLVAIDDGSEAPLDGLGSVPFADALAGGSAERDFAPRSPDDHYVIYTGGTTGMPKGVVWRHEDVFYGLGGGVDAYTNERITSEHELADRAAKNETPLVSLCIPPLMHGAAQWATMRFWFEGNTIVLMPRFDPHDVWATIERERCNVTLITGDAMGRPLIEALEVDPGRYDISSFFVLSSSAAVFSPTVKDRFLDLLPNLLIVDAIGSSESGHNGMVSVAKGNTAMKGGGPTVTAGRDAVVLDDDLRIMEPGDERLGRLARGGNIPIGYYKDPEKTAKTFVTAADGKRYVVPGDVARVEADGAITLLGRGSGCINSGGEKIFPEEVESALKAHDAVFDAVVIGVPDVRWGQAVAAVVETRAGFDRPTLDQLDAHCRERLAGYKVPRHLHHVDRIERSPSGKPDYRWAATVATGG